MTADELAGFVRALWQNAGGTLPATLDSVASLWRLGAEADAATLHGAIGDHDPTHCPICMPGALLATSGDLDSISAALIDGNLAASGVSRANVAPTFDQLLAEAQAAIPFFEQYALDPSMTAQQWADFQAIPQDATAAQVDTWTGDGATVSWPLSAPLDQAQPPSLTVDGAAATVAVAASPDGATTQYVLVQQADGSWRLESGTDPAPAAGVALSLSYTKNLPISKERLLYDVIRTLAALLRYLTGNLPTS